MAPLGNKLPEARHSRTLVEVAAWEWRERGTLGRQEHCDPRANYKAMAAPSKGTGYPEGIKPCFTTHAGKDLGLGSEKGLETRVPARLRQRRRRMPSTSSPAAREDSGRGR